MHQNAPRLFRVLSDNAIRIRPQPPVLGLVFGTRGELHPSQAHSSSAPTKPTSKARTRSNPHESREGSQLDSRRKQTGPKTAFATESITHTKQKGFYLMLRGSLHSEPPPNLDTIFAVHANNPELQSTQSHNLLLNVSINLQNLFYAAKIWNTFSISGCLKDVYTWRLRVRMLMTGGRGLAAYKCALSGILLAPGVYSRQSGPIPLDIWAELMRPARPSRTRRSIVRLASGAIDFEPTPLRVPARHRLLPNARYRHLFKGDVFPSRETFEHMGFDTMRIIVSYLLRHVDHDSDKLAVAITNLGIRRLDKNPAKRDLEQVIGVVNQHFRVHIPSTSIRRTADPYVDSDRLPKSKRNVREPSVQRHLAHHRLLEDFLALHPRLKPDGNTLVLLLGSLRRARASSKHVIAIVNEFQTRWPGALNSAGRRIAASLVVQERIDRSEAENATLRAFVQRMIDCEDAELAGRVEVPGKKGFGQERAKFFRLKNRARKVYSRCRVV